MQFQPVLYHPTSKASPNQIDPQAVKSPRSTGPWKLSDPLALASLQLEIWAFITKRGSIPEFVDIPFDTTPRRMTFFRNISYTHSLSLPLTLDSLPLLISIYLHVQLNHLDRILPPGACTTSLPTSGYSLIQSIPPVWQVFIEVVIGLWCHNLYEGEYKATKDPGLPFRHDKGFF